MKQHALIPCLLTAGLLMTSLPAQAADSATSSRVLHSLGQAIAAQGNIALREVRQELTRNLSESLKPLLPEPARGESGKAPANDGQTQYLPMHEQARSIQ